MALQIRTFGYIWRVRRAVIALFEDGETIGFSLPAGARYRIDGIDPDETHGHIVPEGYTVQVQGINNIHCLRVWTADRFNHLWFERVR